MHAAHDLAALCRERLGEARIEPDVSAFLERESGGSVRIAAALLDAALRFGTVIRMRGAYVWTGTALPPGSLDVLVDELLGEAAASPRLGISRCSTRRPRPGSQPSPVCPP